MKNELNKNQQIQIIYGANIFVVVIFASIVPISVIIMAIKNNRSESILDLWWVYLVCAAFAYLLRVSRKTIIDYQKKSITVINIPHKAIIEAGMLAEISKYFSGYDEITYQENGKLKKFYPQFNIYSSINRKKIIRTLLDFNPQAKIDPNLKSEIFPSN